jgi:hypothetical protein
VSQAISLHGTFVFRFDRGDGQNDVGIEGIGRLVPITLKIPWPEFERTRAGTGRNGRREIQLSKSDWRNHPTAIVGSQFVIRHYGDAAIRNLHSHLAGRDQNPEVRHSSLRPIGEAFRERTFIASIHGIVLSVLGRSRMRR